MADGFSFCFRARGVPGIFAGRQPGWEYEAPLGCDDPMPEEEVFGEVHRPDLECGGLGEVCDPSSATPCCDAAHLCSGAQIDRYRCLETCDPSPCHYGAHQGACLNGGCLPIGFYVHNVDCEVEGEQCETEYGVAEGTRCVFTGHRYACVEACEETGAPCASGLPCLPLVFEEGGVCGTRLGR